MSMQDMSASAISDDVAVSRLFDLARNGQVGNQEFSQLDSVIYERLLQAYGSEVHHFGPRVAE